MVVVVRVTLRPLRMTVELDIDLDTPPPDPPKLLLEEKFIDDERPPAPPIARLLMPPKGAPIMPPIICSTNEVGLPRTVGCRDLSSAMPPPKKGSAPKPPKLAAKGSWKELPAPKSSAKGSRPPKAWRNNSKGSTKCPYTGTPPPAAPPAPRARPKPASAAPPARSPSWPYASYSARRSGSESTSYASATALKTSSAPGCLFLSG
mmetsp:Transcript_4211/g.13146  ORF Transcript_4211/g.13146 Transcript_4211/m.13146 type:complete len:205 (+) Transcript_4211:136-750(+)